jgi:hypothetical protein
MNMRCVLLYTSHRAFLASHCLTRGSTCGSHDSREDGFCFHLAMRWWSQLCSLINHSWQGRNVSRGTTLHHWNVLEVSASHSSHLYHWRISQAPVKLNNDYGQDSEKIICSVATSNRTQMCSSTWQNNVPLNLQFRVLDELVSNLCRATCYLDMCFYIFSRSIQPNWRMVHYDCLLICTPF